ncbi:dTDP-4-dehydrorhamnose 3,5-epimerase [Candidatus Daviesbacteria bacterium]|nr:dTDP-4-dehydrorhamnose 3,5-epimerase [Candidatus Daviesbacteria bacterium]
MDDNFIKETELNGVFIIARPTFEDERGFFRESFRKRDLDKRLGYEFNPVQSNHSRSKKGVLRGIHVAPWHKLATVISGAVQQVVVDLRKKSPTFGQHISMLINEENRISLCIPAGCGNAYLVLSDGVDYTYLTTDYWSAGKELGIIYNDPKLNIKWEIDSPILSEKDLENPPVSEIFP